MHRWVILLLGLIALLLFFVISIPDSVRTISQDVRQNAAASLTSAGFGTVNVAASGRILTLTGDVSSDAQKSGPVISPRLLKASVRSTTRSPWLRRKYPRLLRPR